jgi:hypothetical protein
LTPLGQSDRAFLLEDVTAVEVAVLMEVVVDRGVNGGNFCKVVMSLNFPIAPLVVETADVRSRPDH